MRNNVKLTRITALLTVISLVITIVIHYGFEGREADFWCNVSLAIFGSGLLTCITACIGYVTEKKRTLESFLYKTTALVRLINKYEFNWDLEKKIDFFLDYFDVDKFEWDAHMGQICFLCDVNREKYKYIHKKIYMPILELNQKVAEHALHFRWHKDGSGTNAPMMEKFIAEIEEKIKKECIGNHTGEEGEVLQSKLVRNKLVFAVGQELHGRYFELMYGRKVNRKQGGE